jgi:acetyl-CoA synthetase
MDSPEIVWRPDPETASRTRIARFMRQHGCASLEALQQRSVADIAWYWDAVARDLGWLWSTPYRQVVDTSRGIQWPRWFVDGRMNLAANCLEKHLSGQRRDAVAVISEAEDGTVRTLTYAELAQAVGRLANALRRLGVGANDTVGVFLPMCQEAVTAVLAISRLGAIYTPCFSGYGAQAVATRLQDCDAKVLITADAFTRRGHRLPMKQTADEAVTECPTVQHVIVDRRTGASIPWTAGRDVWWHEAVRAESPVCEALPVEADHPALIIHTSGTTGRPKGAVLTHGGFGMKAAHDWAYLFDANEHTRMFWVTDLGWLMGPLLITGTLLLGGTVLLFEGTPDYPQPDRLWALCERHRITHLGISPTAVRALMPHGADWVTRHDLSALRIIGSTGEPWNPEPYMWLFEHAGSRHVPIINYTGGTEISGGILGCFPNAPIKPCAFYGPIPGMAADCFHEDGQSVRGAVGELVVTQPWPGMTAGSTRTASGLSTGARTTRSNWRASGWDQRKSSQSWWGTRRCMRPLPLACPMTSRGSRWCASRSCDRA